jgi:hypothetical protein
VASAVAVLAAAAVTVPQVSRRGGTTRVVVGTADAGRRLPAGSAVIGAWTMVPKKAAGLGSGTDPASIAVGGDTLLLGGARPAGAAWIPAVWRSRDALHWSQARTPAANGRVSAIAIHGQTALAIGENATSVPFVWRSTDDGATWSVLASASDSFGAPQPAMGRPFIEGIMWARGSWIASGGASNGYAGVWVSRDGTHWGQTLPGNVAGSVSVVQDGEGGLFAYWTPFVWTTRDPRRWNPSQPSSLPKGYALQAVATGLHVAIGQDPVFNKPSPLLVSRDHGRTWSVEPDFPGQAPGATALAIVQSPGFTVVAGHSGSANRPDAWVSSDLATWRSLPDQLKGGPGGGLDLAAVLDGRAALLAGGAALDRFYVLNLTELARPGP